jgi:hypothetical protein
LDRTRKRCISGQQNVAANLIMAGRKTLLMPYAVVCYFLDAIKLHAKEKLVILIKTRNGCGMLIFGNAGFS